MVWKLVERASRGIVFRRRFPAKSGGGVFYAAPEICFLRYWRLNTYACDPCMFDLVAEQVKPGTRVWDIGANLGLFAFPAAFAAGPSGFVLAIEADIEAARLLLMSRRKLDSSRNAQLEVFPVAVSDASQRIATFQIAARCRGANALEGYGGGQMGGHRESRPVPTFSLDQLLDHFPVPDFVKIDVEGAELSVLQGGTRLFTEIRPVMALEVTDTTENLERVGELLAAFRYRMYDADASPATRVESTVPFFNTLAIPA